MSAAFTPRVRVLAVCDDAVASEIEADVFSLEGVRYGFGAESFPHVRSLTVYLMLAYPRGGSFVGLVSLLPFGEQDSIQESDFVVDFEPGSHIIALAVELEDCTFPDQGVYVVEVRFLTKAGKVLKSEQPFHVWQFEE
jgi:hypothetical protein